MCVLRGWISSVNSLPNIKLLLPTPFSTPRKKALTKKTIAKKTNCKCDFRQTYRLLNPDCPLLAAGVKKLCWWHSVQRLGQGYTPPPRHHVSHVVHGWFTRNHCATRKTVGGGTGKRISIVDLGTYAFYVFFLNFGDVTYNLYIEKGINFNSEVCETVH